MGKWTKCAHGKVNVWGRGSLVSLQHKVSIADADLTSNPSIYLENGRKKNLLTSISRTLKNLLVLSVKLSLRLINSRIKFSELLKNPRSDQHSRSKWDVLPFILIDKKLGYLFRYKEEN